jgi:hypothetical protein
MAKQSGLIAALVTQKEVASVRWHNKGDYFVTVSPKAGASSVLIHQLSKGNRSSLLARQKERRSWHAFIRTSHFCLWRANNMCASTILQSVHGET